MSAVREKRVRSLTDVTTLPAGARDGMHNRP